MNKNKGIIIVCVILIVVLIGVIIWAVAGGNNTQINSTTGNTNVTNTNSTNQTNRNNTTANTTANNTTSGEQTNTAEGSENTNVVGNEESGNTAGDNGEQTDIEKVIDLAKGKWGATDNSITVNIENKEGNIYMVSVRDANTTAALAWYSVNLSTGEVTEQ